MTKVLVIESSKSIRNTLKERLEYEGYSVESLPSYDQADLQVQRLRFDVVICDRLDGKLPNGVPFIYLSSDPSVEAAVGSVKAGASDFIAKPIDMNHLLGAIRKIDGGAAAPQPAAKSASVRRTRRQTVEPIIGESPQILHVKHLIDKVAPSMARVLITGSNGTGKELVAHWLHAKSARADAPFVEVNCAAIPSELIESELFGHEKGAFTSAVKQRKGKFEQADGGTLFMDEIGDMSLPAQAKVLRALQENKISRVGSDRDLDVDVRVIAATNKNLREEIAAGRFREDLYHRLSVIMIHVPALCDRREDIPLLVRHFIASICDEYDIPVKEMEPEAVAELQAMPWSGNIRELRNVIERLIILSGDTITLEDTLTYAAGTDLATVFDRRTA
ncbi:MAG: sigma-54-dependent Fis family transcriptional regulator [Rikenellaceae bacterium]|nr:sigma-54-dependent Fis family transcriptional regulator [Rikenellaceae bacterium]